MDRIVLPRCQLDRATARSIARRRPALRFRARADRPAPRSRRRLRAAGGVMKSNRRRREGVSPGQACVFYRCASGRRACSAADSSKRDRKSATAEGSGARRYRSAVARRGECADKISGRGHGFRYRPRWVARLMSAGRRSTIWYSQGFRSRPPVDHRRGRQDRRTDSRCRCRHGLSLSDYRGPRNCAASIFPNRCCARPQQRVRALGALQCRDRWRSWTRKNLAFADSIFRCGGGAICQSPRWPDPRSHAG